MTITYPDGTVVEALLLSRGDDTLRAAVPGADELRGFGLVDGTWRSENSEPVKIEFAPQRGAKPDVPVESECICPKELAFHLISKLRGREGNKLPEDRVFVLSPEGRHARIQSNRLHGRQVYASVRPGSASALTL
jgi:hypothetical protein